MESLIKGMTLSTEEQTERKYVAIQAAWFPVEAKTQFTSLSDSHGDIL